MTPLETSFPVERINPLALAEGNAKQPIYRMHKWWARRLGSVFRMITLATLWPAGRGHGAGGALQADENASAALWRAFEQGADLGGKVVLDPFMGGGTTVVEALRLGCRVVGVDINPVAWFVTKKEVEPADPAELDAAFAHLERTAGARIKTYYRTTCPGGHPAAIMYVFWVKVAECAGCHAPVRLFPNYELSRRDHGHVSCCPACLEIVTTPRDTPGAQCPACGLAYDPRKGVAGRGKFRCGDCGTEGRVLEAVRAKGGPLQQFPHALEGFCPDCGRFFKKMDAGDNRVWEQARQDFDRLEPTLGFPRGAIPAEGRSDPRPINHGYTHYRDMFNARQLLCLSLLLEEILRLPEENARELMLTAFSDCLDANTMFCKYEVAWHKISLFFGLHAYHPIERPTENNVWGTRFGRGTFTRCFQKVRRAKGAAQSPGAEKEAPGEDPGAERALVSTVPRPRLVSDFSQLQATPGGALLRCASSERLDFLPDGVVDAVITDPPYFDNVQYAELADFFHVWLHQALKAHYPWFGPASAGNGRELVKNDRLGKTTEFFNDGLRGVFAECRRVLKPEGALVFTFHHNQTWAWEGLARLLLHAGFYVSACPIVRSEGKSGFHSSAGNIKYDAVLVCRKTPTADNGGGGNGNGAEIHPTAKSRAALEQAILADAGDWARRTVASGMTLGEPDLFTIIMGQALKHATQAAAREVGNGAGAAEERRSAAEEGLGELLQRCAQGTAAVRALAGPTPVPKKEAGAADTPVAAPAPL